MDHVFVYGPSSDVKRSPFCGPHIADLQTGPVRQDLPGTCKECGGNCSKTERNIYLAELDGVDIPPRLEEICEDKKTMLYAQQSLQQIGGEKPDIILIEEFP